MKTLCYVVRTTEVDSVPKLHKQNLPEYISIERTPLLRCQSTKSRHKRVLEMGNQNWERMITILINARKWLFDSDI